MISNDLKVHRKKFIKKLTRNIVIGLFLILISLYIGMLGYHHYGAMSWVDSYLNAAMILSGMGQINDMMSMEGKIFAGTYALFSGIIFLVIIAIVFGPVIHHLFVKFKIPD